MGLEEEHLLACDRYDGCRRGFLPIDEQRGLHRLQKLERLSLDRRRLVTHRFERRQRAVPRVMGMEDHDSVLVVRSERQVAHVALLRRSHCHRDGAGGCGKRRSPGKRTT